MKAGELFKITSDGNIYWGIFIKPLKKENLFYAIKDCWANFTGLSGSPTLPIPKIKFKKGTKIRRWKPKTFDKKICYFGLAVREGKFWDRLTMTSKTCNMLIKQFKSLRKHNLEFMKIMKKNSKLPYKNCTFFGSTNKTTP